MLLAAAPTSERLPPKQIDFYAIDVLPAEDVWCISPVKHPDGKRTIALPPHLKGHK